MTQGTGQGIFQLDDARSLWVVGTGSIWSISVVTHTPFQFLGWSILGSTIRHIFSSPFFVKIDSSRFLVLHSTSFGDPNIASVLEIAADGTFSYGPEVSFITNYLNISSSAVPTSATLVSQDKVVLVYGQVNDLDRDTNKVVARVFDIAGNVVTVGAENVVYEAQLVEDRTVRNVVVASDGLGLGIALTEEGGIYGDSFSAGTPFFVWCSVAGQSVVPIFTTRVQLGIDYEDVNLVCLEPGQFFMTSSAPTRFTRIAASNAGVFLTDLGGPPITPTGQTISLRDGTLSTTSPTSVLAGGTTSTAFHFLNLAINLSSVTIINSYSIPNSSGEAPTSSSSDLADVGFALVSWQWLTAGQNNMRLCHLGALGGGGGGLPVAQGTRVLARHTTT